MASFTELSRLVFLSFSNTVYYTRASFTSPQDFMKIFIWSWVKSESVYRQVLTVEGLLTWSKGMCYILPSCRARGRCPRTRQGGNISHTPEEQINHMLIFHFVMFEFLRKTKYLFSVNNIPCTWSIVKASFRIPLQSVGFTRDDIGCQACFAVCCKFIIMYFASLWTERQRQFRKCTKNSIHSLLIAQSCQDNLNKE